MNTTHLRKLRTTSILKWGSSYFAGNQLNSQKRQLWPNGYSLVSPNARLYRTKRTEEESPNNAVRIPRRIKKEAEAALLEYFHSTRNFDYLDAENMSKNSPIFLSKLLKRVNIEDEIGHSIARFLRYNPINEFEPFFESLGLKPSEYGPLLPPHLVFLSDCRFLLENYYLLCGYGFERQKIGKIYKEATEVFSSDVKVLVSKLRAYEKLGIGQASLVKFIISSPYFLIGDDVNADFVEVLERFKSLGLGISWIEGNLLEGNSCNWSHMLGLLTLFSKMGLSKEQLAELISYHPDILFEDSGNRTVLLVGCLLKFGFTMDQISSMLMRFPDIKVGKFVSNWRRCFLFLNEVKMEATDIGDFVRSRALLMGTCDLHRANSLCTKLNVGKKRLCKYISENPQELKNLVLGAKLKPFPRLEEDLASESLRNKFLLDLGFVQDSDKMKAAQKMFRGKGGKLQERFDFIMSYGLDREEVCRMVKVSPQILNLKKNVIQTKIDLLVRQWAYPVSSIWAFPSILNYKVQRVNLRLSMYNWLKGQGKADLSLSTIVASTEKEFVTQFVNRHPSGPQVWQDLKEKIYSI
ncbi:hypothetical protein L484_018030 [Morus notabilis]|uniref:Uncharacterized protein n=1 Tax=Morus notabilis TaxID=981085 RepID=W9RU87_9ROSA|nr:transcription termination factor MTEF18, mitochondrial [Morus notabilis]EXB93644.1 hypothetical protein L484_018030 [Morus notabilis]